MEESLWARGILLKNRMQKAYSFDKATLIKVLKGALISGGAVALTYLLQWITTLDFGVSTPLVVGLLGIIINTIKEWKKGE